MTTTMGRPTVDLATTSPPSRRKRRHLSWPRHVLLAAVSALMIYPLVWMLGSSFKPDTDILGQINPWPKDFTLSNYVEGFTGGEVSFGRFFVNSILLALLAVVGNVLACSVTAYAFARLRFPLRGFWFAVMLVTIMLPAHALLIPQFFVYYQLGWVNTILPLVIPKFLATDAFFIFLMVQFIRGIPRELDEAAAVDGCGYLRIFVRIIFPLLTPALITTSVFTFIWTYNDFFSQLIYLSSSTSQTVPVALRSFLDSTGRSSYGQLMAMSTLSLVPTFVVFLISSRRLTQGVATTGLRG